MSSNINASDGINIYLRLAVQLAIGHTVHVQMIHGAWRVRTSLKSDTCRTTRETQLTENPVLKNTDR